MTRLYARFRIPRKHWKDSNQRDYYMLSALKTAWIVDYAENIWREAMLNQFSMQPLEPDEDMITALMNAKPAKQYDDSQARESLELKQSRLEALQTQFDEWIERHGDEHDRLHRKKHKTDDELNEYNTLHDERMELRERIKRQSKEITAQKAELNKITSKNQREIDKTHRRCLLKARKTLNTDNRLFNEPVRFHVRVHNVTKHLYDAPNAYPTVKPLQDAGTNIGIIWEDDNNTCIPITTFHGGGMLEKDNYVIDVIAETLDEPLMDDPFNGFENHIDDNE